MGTLINIDNGGTLTDICVWDGSDFTRRTARASGQPNRGRGGGVKP